jgi:3-oxoacyl-[acyl-carrier-protein] synthase II
MTSRRRVVVTGLGVVSAAGHDVPTFWRTLLSGRSCVGPITRFDASSYPTRIAAEVRDFDPTSLALAWRDAGHIGQLAAAAVARALADTAPLPDGARDRTGVVVASGMGTYGHAEVFAPAVAASAGGAFDAEAFARVLRETAQPQAAARRTPGSIPTALAREHHLGGPVMSVMTACAAGTQAIGDALGWIRRGRADVVVAAAADSEIYPMGVASFCLLGALSTRNHDPAAASRPFDMGRDGFVIGEGAAALVLEEREHALRRGATPLAEVVGFGSACDAWRATDPHPEGRGAVLAMQRALADAALRPEQLGYVNAHGTSTPANDRIESRALREVLGDHAPRVPVSSTKSIIGHLTVAAGAIEAVACVQTLREQVLHPTLNLSDPDPDCDLDFVPNTARPARVEVAMSNSFAFGGQTASLLLRRVEP